MAAKDLCLVLLIVLVCYSVAHPQPPTQVKSCENHLCPPGQECYLDKTATGDETPYCRTSCDLVDCHPGEHCIYQVVQCFTAPCPPIASCVPLDRCAIVRCRGGYKCINGNCVPNCDGFDCDPGEECYIQDNGRRACRPILTCATINCLRGYICVDRKCIPDPNASCEEFTCGPGEECYLAKNGAPACRPSLTCATIKCKDGYSCVNKTCIPPPTCEGVTCGPGEECSLVSKECTSAPCPPPEPVCSTPTAFSCALLLCVAPSSCVNGQCIPITSDTGADS